MLPDRASNPESLCLESDALPSELRGPTGIMYRLTPRPTKHLKYQKYLVCKAKQMRFVVTTF